MLVKLSNNMKYLNTLLLSLALLAINAKSADLSATANLTAVGTTSGNAVTGNSNLVAYPCVLHSLTFSGTILAGSNNIVYLYDAITNGYVATYTITRPLTIRTNLEVTFTDLFGIIRTRYNSNTIVTVTNITSTSVSKPLLAQITLSASTVMPQVYTFDPPIIFSQGIMITNTSSHASTTYPFTALYNYSPLQ